MSHPKGPEARIANISPYALRLFPDLKQKIEEAAVANGRSINSELTARLKASFELGAEEGTASVEKSTSLTVRLTADMRAKLDALSVRGPYRISITSIIERGIELAALELEKLK